MILVRALVGAIALAVFVVAIGQAAQAQDAVEVNAGDLTVQVRRQPWLLEARSGGQPLFRELDATNADSYYGTLAYLRAGAQSWHHVTAVLADESIPGGRRISAATTEPGAGSAFVEITAAQAGTVRVAFRPPPGGQIAWTVVSAASDEGETLLGLGERFEGVSLAGRGLELWSADRREVKYGHSTYLLVPWMLSSRGFGILLEDGRRSVWELRTPRSDAWAIGVPGGSLAFYLIGGMPAQALERYTALTGRPPIPPRWGLGVVKTLVGGEARVLADAARLKALGIPVDGLYVYDAFDEEAGVGWPHVTYDPIPAGNYPNVRAWLLPSRWPPGQPIRLEMRVDRAGGLAALGVAVVDSSGRRLPVEGDAQTWEDGTIARLAGL